MNEGIAPLLDFIAASVNNLDIAVVRSLATVFWYLEKIAAFITNFLTQENLWDTLLNTLLTAIQNIFPDILNNLLFGSGGSPGGLLYLALMLAGLFLILPNIGGTRLVDPGRVVVWAVVIISLFVGSVWGYDLIAVLEGLRQSSTQTVLDAISDTGSLSDLVTQPMLAEPAEVSDWGFELPSAFANYYYPEPTDSDFATREVVILDNWVTGRWAYELQVETQASQDYRTAQSRQGVLMAALTLVPGFVLLLFGVTFATLAASALVLIIFFLTALPLGFFEFGAPILVGIAKQYAYLFALTLAATILPGVLVGAGTLTFAGIPDVGAMIAYLPILIIVAIAAQYMAQMAFNAMKGTFGIVTSSFRAGVGAYAFNGRLPEAGGIPGANANSAALGLAGLVGMAATGGTSALIMGALSTFGAGGPGGDVANGSPHVFSQLPSNQSANGRPGSTVQNQPIWSTPNASTLLADSVMQSPGALGEEKSAALAMRDMAKEMNLSEDSVAKLFEAVHEAEKEADAVEDENKAKGASIEQVAQKVQGKGIGRNQADYDIHELARLATLVAATAKTNAPKAMAARVIHAPETIKGNQPAAIAMGRLAREMKLDAQSVESVFQAVKDGQKAGLPSQSQTKFVQEKLSSQFPGQSEQLKELSHLAVLVSNGTAVPQSKSASKKKEKKSA